MLATSENFNPFPGLRAFEEHEDMFFFGREKQVDELLKRLREIRFLAVIGSSGSGKSSLVKSGLIPALYSGFMSGVSSVWHVCSFRPGGNPIWSLASALSKNKVLNDFTPNEEDTHAYINESILRRSSAGLVEVYRQSNVNPSTNLLILVDQFEEIFRFIKYEKTQKEGKRDSVAFINLLINAASQSVYPVYIVFTMRSDFLGDCTEFRGLPEMINKGQFLVPRMSREEIKEAITGPVAVGGAEITQRLLNYLLNDLGDNADQLPILQHALMRTWNIWNQQHPKGDVAIDLPEYEAVGKMQFALSQHAEEAYTELVTPRQRMLCEIIFKALTEKGTEARGTRRPRTVAELAEVASANTDEVIAVVNVFRKAYRAFLMPPDDIELSADSIIDISHESLMRIWTRLNNWVEEEDLSAQTYLRLCEAANQYELGSGGTWREPELQIALKWREQNKPNPIWASRYNSLFNKANMFLDYSERLHNLEQAQKEEKQKKRLREIKRIISGISCFAILSLVAAGWALKQQRYAEKQQKVAISKTREALKQQQIVLQQKKIAEKEKLRAIKNARFALLQQQLAEKAKASAITSEQYAVKQSRIAKMQTLLARHSTLAAKNAQANAETETRRAKNSDERAQRETQNSTRLKNQADAKVAANQAVMLLNENKQNDSRDTALKAYELNRYNGGLFQNNEIYQALNDNFHLKYNWLFNNISPVRAVAVTPQTNEVLTINEAGLLTIYGSANGGLRQNAVRRVVVNARGMAVSATGQQVIIITADGIGKMYLKQNTYLKEIAHFTFNGVGKAVSFLNASECIILTSQGIGKVKLTDNVAQLDFMVNPAITAFYINSASQILIAAGGKVTGYANWVAFKYHTGNVCNYNLGGVITALSQDVGMHCLAAGTASRKVWLVLPNGQQSSFSIHASAVSALQFCKIDSLHLQLATAGADQVIHLIDITERRQRMEQSILTLRGHTQWIYGISYAANGQYLYSVGEDEKLILWQTTMSGLYRDLQHTNKK